MKVCYLYSGSRKKFTGTPGVDYPDTQLYGLNHLKKFTIDAKYAELGPRLERLVGFRLRHVLLYFCTRGCDVVFGSSLLYSMALRKLWRTRQQFVLLNIGLTRTLATNRGLRHRLIEWLLNELGAIVCLAQFQKEYLEEQCPFLKGRVFFVPLGVDVDFHRPVYDGRGSYLLSVGRDNGRDYATVVAAARLMPQREFHIVCSKRNLAGVEDIPANVKVFYDLPPAAVYAKYYEAAALLLITRGDSLEDGSDCSGQTVLLEAMASGLPVIASRKKYLADYCVEGQEAVVVDPYDPAQLAGAVDALLRDLVPAKEMARAARRRVEADFSTEKMAEHLAGVFSSLA